MAAVFAAIVLPATASLTLLAPTAAHAQTFFPTNGFTNGTTATCPTGFSCTFDPVSGAFLLAEDFLCSRNRFVDDNGNVFDNCGRFLGTVDDGFDNQGGGDTVNFVNSPVNAGQGNFQSNDDTGSDWG